MTTLSPSYAQDAEPTADSPAASETAARQRFEQATELYRTNRFALAAQEFEAVHGMMDGHPRQAMIAFNIGQCYAQLGETRRARRWLQRYLDETPDGAPNRDSAETMLAELNTRIGLAEGEASEHGSDEEGRSESADDHGSEHLPPASDSTNTSTMSPVGPIVLAVGGAAVIAGAIVGGIALAQRADITSQCSDAVCPAELESDADALRPLAGAADGLLWGGAAVAATGLILTLVLRDSDDTSPTASFGCSADRCVGTLRGTF